ncbi:MAG: TolC family outer membrane protein [Betaproteobacteria bacterium]|nr:TolC family outer membrane protein [Betaproteobacteria bacterium]
MAIKHTIMRTTLALMLANVYAISGAQQQNMPPPDPSAAQAPVQQSLRDAAQKAVLNSPEVLARWHAFRAATEEVGVVRGGFLPRVDATAGIGRERITQNSTKTDLDYNRRGYGLTLNQMLFDGFATSNDVKRLGKAKLVRYFELLDVSETVALEAGRAYLDVVRFRELAKLAEQNYAEHQTAHDQLKQRFDSGVGKRVDVDQAASRLALADVNLTTTYANLHDVTARYLRIVGEQPGKGMPQPGKPTQELPPSVESALLAGLKTNPALRATVENIESSQYDLDARRSAFSPKLDFKAYSQVDNNYLGSPGNRHDSAVELVLNYNLFNGGSDVARNRQYRERKNIAIDEREKACRDMRQTLSIAYNDALRLKDQLGYIATQVDLVEKTRAAYQDQFKIGQRTLLDLLNTQNEYFDARRAQVNAENDLSLAYLRTYAGMGRLLENLGLKRVEDENSPDARDLAEVDMSVLCPPASPPGSLADRGAVIPKPVPVAAAPMAAAPVIQVPEQTGGVAEVTRRVEDWRAAWVSRSTQNYLPFYSANFIPEGSAPHTETGYVPDGTKQRAAWERQRKQRLAGAIGIAVEIQNLVVRMSGQDMATAEFRQVYRSDSHSDTVNKTLDWRKEGGEWKIVREYTR